MRKIGILISITLHLCLIYWLFTTAIPTANLVIKERVITVIPIAPGYIVLHDTPWTEKSQPKPMVATPGKRSNRSPLPALNLDGTIAKSLPPLLRHKPDFLLQGEEKKPLPNPFDKIQPEREIDLRQYLSSYAHPYGNPRLGKDLSGAKDHQQPKEDESYKQKTGRIDFDVPGFNIKPWVKQVINKIQLNWQVPPGLLGYSHTSLTVGIQVTIEKSGSLSAVEIGQSSLVDEMDRAAVSALKMSAPFPGLPAEFPDKNMVAYLRFNVNNND